MPKEEKKDVTAADPKAAEVKPAEVKSVEVKPEQKVAKKEERPNVRAAGKKKGGGKKDSFGKPDDGMIERVVKISRVAKVVKGGKNFSFNATVIVGDGNGKVGMGFGKSNEVVEAIRKGSSKARKSLIPVKMKGETIPHEVIGVFKASRVMLKPASSGTGVIAGGPVRALCDAVGIKNILTKSLGSRNAINVINATIEGFSRLRLSRRG
ncbi:MAG: 30S ribosomal protein S5 [Candidatus Omnitrophica bacterium]|nr:30S ribosomal protein S5 [Candidatus Omnitrophota bacterium]